MALKIEEILKGLPPAIKIPAAREEIRRLNQGMKIKIVALDDDPTGCQTVHDVKVLMSWEPQVLRKALRENDFFFVLTNSRAFSEDQAIAMNLQIVEHLLEFVHRDSLRIISRSDSTLRGHFAGETNVLMNILGPFDGILIIPYFKEGGRFTVDDTHYVLLGDELVKAHKTEFASDPVFGFKNSYLPAWIEEKSQGFWKKEDVASITLDDIRQGGPERVYEKLNKIDNARPIVVNALCDEDLEVVVLGLCRAEEQGKRFLYRSAASFVKIRAGISDAHLYDPAKHEGNGLIIVGSYVEKTTRQLNYMLERAGVQKIEVTISRILGNSSSNYLSELIKVVDDVLFSGTSVVVYTERMYALGGDNQQRLDAGKRVSDFLCELVGRITRTPNFIIAKGGITSCDVAKKGLKVEEAVVLGQILPGVPVWQLGQESKHPELLYVVFPGNVGSDESLYEAYTKFSRENRTDNGAFE